MGDARNDGCTFTERIGSAAAGRLVGEWLPARWRHGDAATWRARIARGEVTLDGRVASGAERLAAGARLEWRRPPWIEPAVPLAFALLHRDDELLVVAKPAGLPTLPSAGRFLRHTLLAQARRRFGDVTPVHRLDRGTSGLVVLARTRAARRELARSWAQGAVTRRYLARVVGEVAAPSATLLDPIGEVPHPRLGRVFAAAPDGRAARTDLEVVERRAGETLLALSLATGRPHQIRIHLAAFGHPLVGEPFYGPGGRPRGDQDPANPGDVGYRLHAWRLGLDHPTRGERLELECPPPPDLLPSAGRPRPDPDAS